MNVEVWYCCDVAFGCVECSGVWQAATSGVGVSWLLVLDFTLLTLSVDGCKMIVTFSFAFWNFKSARRKSDKSDGFCERSSYSCGHGDWRLADFRQKMQKKNKKIVAVFRLAFDAVTARSLRVNQLYFWNSNDLATLPQMRASFEVALGMD